MKRGKEKWRGHWGRISWFTGSFSPTSSFFVALLLHRKNERVVTRGFVSPFYGYKAMRLEILLQKYEINHNQGLHNTKKLLFACPPLHLLLFFGYYCPPLIISYMQSIHNEQKVEMILSFLSISLWPYFCNKKGGRQGVKLN